MILGAPSTKAHSDVEALLVGKYSTRRVTPASPVLRVAASICFKNCIGWPCGLQRLRPFCRQRRASNQSSIIGPVLSRFREPEIAGAALQMHRFSPRASPPNTKRPRDHRACPYVVQFHFQDRSRRASSNTSLRSRTSAIENARSRVIAPTHHYLTQTRAPASASRLDTVAQASTGCSSTRPRPCRQASTTSVPKTRAALRGGPLAANTARRRGASRRRFPTTPYGGAAERRE